MPTTTAQKKSPKRPNFQLGYVRPQPKLPEKEGWLKKKSPYMIQGWRVEINLKEISNF
jgi:hypothetical protein